MDMKVSDKGAGKCPYTHIAGVGRTNRDWWPNQLRLDLLHQHSALSNPMGTAFDYAAEFNRLDLAAVKRDLTALMTDAELVAFRTGGGQANVTGNVNACMKEYDAGGVAANRKAAIEYCLQSNDYFSDSTRRPLFDGCMDTHDMLQAMCNQRTQHLTNYQMRKLPGIPPALPVACPGLQPSPAEIKAILSAPQPRAMAELPPKFLAAPPP